MIGRAYAARLCFTLAISSALPGPLESLEAVGQWKIVKTRIKKFHKNKLSDRRSRVAGHRPATRCHPENPCHDRGVSSFPFSAGLSITRAWAFNSGGLSRQPGCSSVAHHRCCSSQSPTPKRPPSALPSRHCQADPSLRWILTKRTPVEWLRLTRASKRYSSTSHAILQQIRVSSTEEEESEIAGPRKRSTSAQIP